MDPTSGRHTTPDTTPSPALEGSTPGWAMPPGWGAASSSSSGRFAAFGGGRRLLTILVPSILIILGLIGGGYRLFVAMTDNGQHGRVVFSTDNPKGMRGCDITGEVTSVKVGTPVFATYVWTRQINAGEDVVEEDFKDGILMATYQISEANSVYNDCLGDTTSVSHRFSTPGAYEIKVSIPLGVDSDTGTMISTVVADGTLTLTP
jgi:hypothetical protein